MWILTSGSKDLHCPIWGRGVLVVKETDMDPEGHRFESSTCRGATEHGTVSNTMIPENVGCPLFTDGDGLNTKGK